MRSIRFLVLVSTLALTPLSIAVAQDVKIHPLSEVSDGPLPKLTKVGPKSAGLTFKSNVPMACTVVYGETRDFGMIANDPDMSSIATIDHNPVIGKLQPETKYFFRVQGITATGKLYAGKVRTFTTPAQIALSGGLEVLKATVKSVSSNYGDGKNADSWGADSAIDEDPSTAWSSNGDGSDAYLVLDFGKPVEIEWVKVWTRTMSDGTAQMTSFKITTDKGESFGPFTLPDAKKPYRFSVKTTASTLRIDADKSSGGNTGLIEISALGKTVK